MSRPPKILVAGIGNIFLGDDAFGSEVARRLMQETLPGQVQVLDFGIRSYDLAYAMMDDYEVTILIDIISRGEPAGTVYLMKPDLQELEQLDDKVADAHSMNVVRVLQMLRALGRTPEKLYLIGCEPATLEIEDGQIGLSETVEAAVPRAMEMIRSLINDLLNESPSMEVEPA
jgi:hydrogenase maturation protease